jgi:nitroimidazol reductase NimA-like FMN-containing flavoprotein (pyridoxamine 5'-phosphate oxidase superfamily)
MGDVQQGIAERVALQQAGTRSVMPLSMRETIELLERQKVGRFAYVARKDVPDVVPVNYTWVDGAVLIRSGPGPKLQAAQRKDTVALEVDEIDDESRTGCSAVVVGAADVLDPHQVSSEVEVWAGGPHQHVIRIRPTRISGRRLG